MHIEIYIFTSICNSACGVGVEVYALFISLIPIPRGVS